MTLPSSGSLTWDQVVVEIGLPSGTALASNDSRIYTLVGKTPGSPIVFPTDFYGRSWVDTTPDVLTLGSFTTQPNIQVVSRAAQVTGINAAASISINAPGGVTLYSINNGAFVSTPGTVNPGDIVRVLQQAHGTSGISRTATVTIGGVASNFVVTSQTGADTFPTNFGSWGSNITGASQSTYYTTGTQTVAGLGTSVATSVTISGTGAEYRVNNGPWVSYQQGVVNGDTVQLRILSGGAQGVLREATVTCGNNTTWAVTTTEGTDHSLSAVNWNNINASDTLSFNIPSVSGVNNTVTLAGITKVVTLQVSISGFSSFNAFASIDVYKNGIPVLGGAAVNGTLGTFQASASDQIYFEASSSPNVNGEPYTSQSADWTTTIKNVTDSSVTVDTFTVSLNGFDDGGV